jgi:hypothetical protein
MERRTIEVALETPVTGKHGEIVLSKLVLREPRVRELRIASNQAEGKSGVAMATSLLAACSDTPEPLIDAMTLEDFNRANEALGELMPKALRPEAGGTARGF